MFLDKFTISEYRVKNGQVSGATKLLVAPTSVQELISGTRVCMCAVISFNTSE